MSKPLTCGICGKSYTTNCSCRYNTTPLNLSKKVDTPLSLRPLHQIINDELELWEKELKEKEQMLKLKEEELNLREQKINEYEKNVSTETFAPKSPIPQYKDSKQYTFF